MNYFLALCFIAISLYADVEHFSKKEVFVDKNTKLMWQDDSDVKGVRRSWREAVGYCENLTSEGRDDWTLPNLNMLEDLYENKFLLKNISKSSYWSSSPDVTDTNNAAHVDFCNGNSDWSPKVDLFLVRCVRTDAQKIK